MSCVSVITWIPILITLLISVMECVTCWFQCSTNSEIDIISWMNPRINKLHWWTASDYITIKVSHSHMKDVVLICFSPNLDQCVNFTVFWIVPLEPYLVQQALKLTTCLCHLDNWNLQLALHSVVMFDGKAEQNFYDQVCPCLDYFSQAFNSWSVPTKNKISNKFYSRNYLAQIWRRYFWYFYTSLHGIGVVQMKQNWDSFEVYNTFCYLPPWLWWHIIDLNFQSLVIIIIKNLVEKMSHEIQGTICIPYPQSGRAL